MRAGNDPASGFFGCESKLADIFPDTVGPTHPIGLTSEREHGGRGDAARRGNRARVSCGGRGPDHRRPAPRHGAQALDVMLPYRRGRI